MAALGEKEILLKEVHHRVKNNMQIISSLLTLQDSKAGNDELHRYFQESIDRIHAMALVHNQLYQSRDFSRIELGEYTARWPNGCRRFTGRSGPGFAPCSKRRR